MTSPNVRKDRRLNAWQLFGAAAVFAVMVKLRWFTGVDQAYTEWFLSRRTPGLDGVMRTLTFFGSSTWVLGVMALMSKWWLRRGDRRTPVILWSAWGLGTFVQVLLRLMVAQWRPDTSGVPVATDLWARFEFAGFPSGHAFRAAFLYGWWARVFKQRGVHWLVGWGCLLFVVGVSFTRVYLGRHWMSDVAGSWLLATWALAVARSWQGAATKDRPA